MRMHKLVKQKFVLGLINGKDYFLEADESILGWIWNGKLVDRVIEDLAKPLKTYSTRIIYFRFAVQPMCKL